MLWLTPPRLKCCRTHPCSNCKKRGEAASCTYIGRGPRGKAQQGRSSPSLVQDRLQHLENLVMSLAQKNNRSDEPEDINFNAPLKDDPGEYATPSPSTDRETKSPPLDAPGKLVVKNEEISYIDSAHWRAILEEINGVKEFLDENGVHSDDEGVEYDPYDDSSPALLLGIGRPVSKEELLIDIPAQSVADRLVSRFLKTSEPSLGAFEPSSHIFIP
ncbi:hypothetical protein N7474_010076 [Penicillium riverlandense]|uniref:uncharacterized protein n=1 Tax=Penicillium riverlandense TaxID=1903569 RepID=UPI002547F040|nr:uncharacterized protein N7474_010076 [Penicillium riverlandense]KAJ5808807.1 hypothetical protein N7474_010076 [Penicillium riverlandense]